VRPIVLALLAFSPVVAAPPEVPVVKPVEREVFDHEDFTGRTDASTIVEIRSRLTGFLDKIAFKEGATVKKGDLLFQIDHRVQRAEVDKAQAEVKRGEAGLKRAEADLARIAAVKNGPREELDKATTAVEESKAALLAARATLEMVKLHLEYTRITSPIDGRVGRPHAVVGTLVTETDRLATVVAVDPVYVYFDVDERTMLRLMEFARDRKIDQLTVGVALNADGGFPLKAAVDLPKPVVDPKTGTVRVRAVLANPKDEVWPGRFALVRLPLGDNRKALFVPETAVGRLGGEGRFVLVVNAKGVLEARRVRLGPADGGRVEVVEGLKADEWVVRDPQGRSAGEDVRAKPTADAPSWGPKPEGRGGAAAPARPLPDLPGSGPALVVTATYPGANARTIEDTVARPIETEINGMEKVTHRVLACSDDGTMRLTLLFEKGTDLNAAQRLAQDRVSLAVPHLPDAVIRLGITIRKRGVHLAAVALVSPTDRYDRLYLAKFAKLQLRDELARVPGVADVSFFGDTEPGPQVHLLIDREKVTKLGLTTTDVMNVLRDQGLVPELSTGRHLSVAVTGRLPDPELLKRLEVRNDQGQRIRLGTVMNVEVGEGWTNTTSVDGKPCALLLVSRLTDSDGKDTVKALRERLAELTKRLPEGLELKVVGEEP
jgi:RND family efflux transporter MFP subunit